MIELTNQQRRAFDMVKSWYAMGSGIKPFVLGGYAGTGKTTIAKLLAEIAGGPVVYCAYTGKAALVMQQNGCVGAMTIHSAIYQSKGDAPEPREVEALREDVAKLEAELQRLKDAGVGIFDKQRLDLGKMLGDARDRLHLKTKGVKRGQPMFTKREDAAVCGAKLIVVDEASMADKKIAEDLESYGVPILALGDPAQLPPVAGTGGFFNRPPDFTLTEVHRQAKGSGILEFATEVRQGSRPMGDRYGDDCVVRPLRNLSRDALADLALGVDQVIVGRNATRRSWNHSMRERLGLAQGENPRHPVAGDRIVGLRNDYDAGVLNGSQWKVLEADCDEDIMRAFLKIEPLDFTGPAIEVNCHLHHFLGREDELKPSEHREAQSFTYAYAVTCHKSQGSQWDKVLVVDESAAFREDWWRHLYTAATRAKKHLTVLTMP